MKRFPICALLLLILLLVGCSSTKQRQEVDATAVEQALISVVKLASQSVDANLFSSMGQRILPAEAIVLSQRSEIPLFLERLDLYKAEVLQAYRQTILEAPTLVAESLARVVWIESPKILQAGNQSATEELLKQQGPALRESLEAVLRRELASSRQNWDMLLDRYSIWQRGTEAWTLEALTGVTVDPLEHQIEFFLSVYLRQLAFQEQQLRTTPVIRGSGSFLEIFQQEGR